MNTEKKTIGDVIFVNILISVSLTFISYLYILFNLSDTAILREFLLRGQPFAIDYVASSMIMKYLPLLPVFMTWLFIGVLVYFFYYSLSNVYGFAYNRLLIASYNKSEQISDFKFQLRIAERMTVHLVAILGFIGLLLITAIILLPFSANIYLWVESFSLTSNISQFITIWAPIMSLYFYWTILVGLIQLAWHYVKRLEDYETFKAEHEAI
jgi:hypothetical protein